MTTVAYIANEFPSPLEPYVIDEIAELRRRGAQVICCSGKRVSPNDLSLAERASSVNRPDGSVAALIDPSLRYLTYYGTTIFLVRRERSEMILWC